MPDYIDPFIAKPTRWVGHCAETLECPDGTVERLMALGDSFVGYYFGDMTAQHARRTVRYFGHHLIPALLDREKPQLVIEEIAECQLAGFWGGPQDP